MDIAMPLTKAKQIVIFGRCKYWVAFLLEQQRFHASYIETDGGSSLLLSMYRSRRRWSKAIYICVQKTSTSTTSTTITTLPFQASTASRWKVLQDWGRFTAFAMTIFAKLRRVMTVRTWLVFLTAGEFVIMA